MPITVTLNRALNTAKASQESYGDATPLTSDPNWMELANSGSSNFGFYGQAFRNLVTGEVIVSYRGTDDILDLVGSDFPILMGLVHLAGQVNLATEFYDDIRLLDSSIQDSDITITGHSLGGSLAQIVGASTGLTTIAFNPLGIDSITPSLTEIYRDFFGLPNDPSFPNITTISAASDLAHKVRGQLGNLLELPIGSNALNSLFGLSPSEYFEAVGEDHSIIGIVNHLEASGFVGIVDHTNDPIFILDQVADSIEDVFSKFVSNWIFEQLEVPNLFERVVELRIQLADAVSNEITNVYIVSDSAIDAMEVDLNDESIPIPSEITNGPNDLVATLGAFTLLHDAISANAITELLAIENDTNLTVEEKQASFTETLENFTSQYETVRNETVENFTDKINELQLIANGLLGVQDDPNVYVDENLTVNDDGDFVFESNAGNDTYTRYTGTIGDNFVDTGRGNDKVNVYSTGSSFVNTGAGIDTISIQNGSGIFSTGTGNDKVLLRDVVDVYIDLGAGNDLLTVGGINSSADHVGGTINFGAGTNTFVLGKTNLDPMTADLTLMSDPAAWVFVYVENGAYDLNFGPGRFVVNADSTTSLTTTTYGGGSATINTSSGIHHFSIGSGSTRGNVSNSTLTVTEIGNSIDTSTSFVFTDSSVNANLTNGSSLGFQLEGSSDVNIVAQDANLIISDDNSGGAGELIVQAGNGDSTFDDVALSSFHVGSGDNTFWLDNGDVIIRAGDGHNEVNIGGTTQNADVIVGDGGNDITITGNPVLVDVTTGSGVDILRTKSTTPDPSSGALVTVRLGEGDDIILPNGSSGGNYFAEAGNDLIIGGGGWVRIR